MQTPLELTFNNFAPSAAVEARIRRRVAKLERYFERMTSCHVWVDAVHTSPAPTRRRGKTVSYEIRIELRVPGADLAISRKPGDIGAHKNIMVAIRDSFDAMERRLKDHVRKLRGAVKSHRAPLQGRIARLFPDQGYGFVATIDGQEIYFHAHSVIDTPFDALVVGAPVELLVAEGESPDGPQATTLRPIRPLPLLRQP
jgi:cold shock CspA family protein